MKTRHAAALVFALIGTGCTFANPTYTQNGRGRYTVTCSSDEHQRCYDKANQLCRERGYDVYQETGGEVFSIVIACKGSDSKALIFQI